MLVDVLQQGKTPTRPGRPSGHTHAGRRPQRGPASGGVGGGAAYRLQELSRREGGPGGSAEEEGRGPLPRRIRAGGAAGGCGRAASRGGAPRRGDAPCRGWRCSLVTVNVGAAGSPVAGDGDALVSGRSGTSGRSGAARQRRVVRRRRGARRGRAR
jgi:hypothetical protein